MARASSLRLLAAGLFALSVLYSIWFHDDRHRVAVAVVFVLPPLLLLAGVLTGRTRAAFWAGTLGLAWFAHGVMVAWSRPPERGFALVAIALALLIVFAASWPGLRARFARRGRTGPR